MPSTVHDPTVLRAISHPVRTRILGELRATDLGRLLDIPVQASFDLRQLAKYGRDQRDRVWRSVNPEGLTVDVDSFASQPGGRAAGEVSMPNTADEDPA